MPSCEKCWRDAHAAGDVVEEYNRLLKSRVCTPEQQAGDAAERCPTCHRLTLHQWTRECMNPDCRAVSNHPLSPPLAPGKGYP